jgi:hypothetical protein
VVLFRTRSICLEADGTSHPAIPTAGGRCKSTVKLRGPEFKFQFNALIAKDDTRASRFLPSHQAFTGRDLKPCATTALVALTVSNSHQLESNGPRAALNGSEAGQLSASCGCYRKVELVTHRGTEDGNAHELFPRSWPPRHRSVEVLLELCALASYSGSAYLEIPKVSLRFQGRRL